MINIGNKQVSDIKLGSANIVSVYKGDELIWPVSTLTNGIVEITQNEAIAGDVLFYNPTTAKLVFGRFVDTGAKYSYDQLTPIGIVTVPASHNIYGDNSCGVISLKTMSLINPESGVTSDEWVGDFNEVLLSTEDPRDPFECMILTDINNQITGSRTTWGRYITTQGYTEDSSTICTYDTQCVNAGTPSPYNYG